MMRALGKGGVPLVCLPGIEELNVRDGGYKPNPLGLFEIGQRVYKTTAVMSSMARSLPVAAVKVFFDGLVGLPVVDNHIWTVIFMHRNPDEIVESCRISRASVETQFDPAEPGDDRWDVFREYNQDDINEVVRLCQQRTDMNLHEVDFADLIADPLSVFEGLRLPIDCKSAAGSIDPKFYRVRK